MNVEKNRKQALVSWASIALLVLLFSILGILQYRWIGEVSRAERDRLRENLQSSLRRLSTDFNADLTLAATRLIPDHLSTGSTAPPEEYAARYLQWRENSRHSRLFQTVALAIPEASTIKLKIFNNESETFEDAPWPAEWREVRERMTERLQGEGGPGRRGGPFSDDLPGLIELPYFVRTADAGPQGWREAEWLLLDVNREYIHGTVLPDLLRRYLGTGDTVEYDWAVVMRDDPAKVVAEPNAGMLVRVKQSPDASVALFDVRPDMMFRRSFGVRGNGGPEMNPRRPPGAGGWRRLPADMGADRGRWQLLVRHRAGSLESVVANARVRNLAVSAAILLLIIAAVGALIRFTRRAQKLAELQMEFVAGVSHELRTPLTVMRTAGHNLRGRVASDPARVQRYGALIEEESEKLTAIVDQVLQFANANAGRVVGVKEEVVVEPIIDDALEASRKAIDEAGCVVEKHIDNPPAILGDPTTLKHAVQNLVVNAAKYGSEGDWIGVYASADAEEPNTLNIRIADHGAGIPREELDQIFEPFYRGKSAVEEQIHGTGLGLSLTKRIVEAHGGRITAESEKGKGSTFTIRIPALAVAHEHELAHSTDRG